MGWIAATALVVAPAHCHEGREALQSRSLTVINPSVKS